MPQSSFKSMARELNTVAWNHAILSCCVIPYANSLNEDAWAHINFQNTVFVKNIKSSYEESWQYSDCGCHHILWQLIRVRNIASSFLRRLVEPKYSMVYKNRWKLLNSPSLGYSCYLGVWKCQYPSSNKECNMGHPESSKAIKEKGDEGTIINPLKEAGPDLITLDIIVTS